MDTAVTESGQPMQVAVVADAELIQGPNGQLLVVPFMATGAGKFMIAMPPAAAEQFIDNFAARVHAVAAEARRQNIGIVMPTAEDLGKLGNGRFQPFTPPPLP